MGYLSAKYSFQAKSPTCCENSLVKQKNMANKKTIDSWVIGKRLGKGGNAKVYEAVHSATGQKCALKVMKSTRANSEPMKRFRAEIEIHKQLANDPGILPMIGYSIPNSLSKESPAWLAMPIAKSIKDALSNKSFEDVIGAIARIAQTLARLAKKDIHHRDLKPNNLFYYKNTWVIGDFGLVDYPGKDPVTTSDKKLGPIYYLAPEMLNAPDKANGELADVYGLAKTLWVLATGQNYPLFGEQRVDSPALTLSMYVEHHRAVTLDHLLERATRVEPEKRPTMREMYTELQAWLDPVENTEAINDFSSVGRLVKALSITEQRKDEKYRRDVQLIDELLDNLSSILEGPTTLIKAEGMPAKGPNKNDTIANLMREFSEENTDKVLTRRGICNVVNNEGSEIILWSGFGIEYLGNGKINIMAGHVVQDRKREKEIVWSEIKKAIPQNSAQQANAIEILKSGFNKNLLIGLEKYADLLKRSRDID